VTSFDELRQHRRARAPLGVCPRCLERPVAGRFVAQIFDKGQGGHVVVGRSRSMCETCCVEVYEAVVAEHVDPYAPANARTATT
jgi:hypothetical protein